MIESDFHLLQAAFHYSPTCLAIMDDSFRMRMINHAMTQFLGFPATELLHRSYFDVFPNGPEREVVSGILHDQREFVSSAEPYHKPGAKAQRYINRKLVPIAIGDSERYVLIIVQDVTDATLLQRELEYNHDTLQSIFDHTSIAVVRTDTTHRILFANQGFYEIFGWHEQELPREGCDGESTEAFACRPWREALDAVLSTRTSVTFQFNTSVDHREEFSYLGEVNPEFHSDGTLRSLITVITDVSETKEREEELETLLVEMNHRIKNNLASVEALARVELHAQGKSKEDAIADITSRISAIGQVHQTLYETRSYSSVLIDGYLKELLYALVSGENAQGCSYTLHLDVEQLTVSTKVATKLGLMLAELTTNTLKYAMCDGGVDIYVHFHRNGDNIEVRYYDSGDNFDPEISSLDDLSTGTGIMILQALVSDLEGTIDLEVVTRPPVFVIRFPGG